MKTNTALKSTSVEKPKDEKFPAPVEKGFKAGMTLVHKAFAALKTTIQSAVMLEPILADASKFAIEHAKEHGDIRIAHRLVMGCREMAHPLAHQYAAELVAFFRKNSPIRWDSAFQCKLLKEGDTGYAPFDTERASEEPFYDMPAAKAARAAATVAHGRALEPLTLDNFIKRVQGTLKLAMTATQKDKDGNVRGIAKGDKQKILDLKASIEKVLPSDPETAKV